MSDPRDYTVGWVCAVTTEYVAARAFLDEVHPGPKYVSEHDNNDYTLGKLGQHNVIIAVLPDGEYGTDSAASVARDMLHTFPNVRIGLMVGIGGGAPSRNRDIRLGDVVVGSLRGKRAVFQYDFSTTIQDQSFRQTRFLGQLPTVLRTAVNELKARYEESGHQLEETIGKILEKKERLRQKYKRPDPSMDRLYQASFTHPPNTEVSCSVICGEDSSNLILRRDRTEMEDNPTIHYGTIASANQLMKDAEKRDTLAREMDVLCFEMEAAGLMSHLPYLVIRGICDYSDSHKNKKWQGYAAMAAAAYAKDLLCRIPPTRVEAEKKISETLSFVEKDIGEMRVTTQETTGAVKDLRSERRGYIERWLSPPDPSTNYNNALQKRHECSGIWFLESDTFAKWKTRRNSFLWLNGIPGCGKTILSSAIIKDLNDTPSSQPLLYFYFDFNDSAKQTLESMVRSLVIQLQCGLEGNWSQLDHLYSSRWHQQPTRELLCKTLSKMIGQVKEVWIILDALDECRTRIGSPTEGLLSWIRDLLESEQRNVHLLVTSRPEPDIKSEVGELAHDDDIVPLQSDLITDDIRAYVHTRIREGNGLKRWRSQPEVQDEIETQIIKQADGMFRLAACQLDALENCVEYRTLQNTLASLPNTLDETYSRILHSIPSEYKLNATRILQFLTYSERPLRIEEAADAIAVDTEGSHYFNPRYRMPDPREITRFCSSLVVLVSTTQDSYDKDEEVVVLQLAHFSVKEYLTSERLDKDVAHSFQEVTAKASIATVCLAYLLHLDQNIQIEKIRGTFPLAQYSAKYWMDHAVVAEAKDGKLQGFIEKLFCHHRNSYWNCYSLYQPDRPWYLGDEGNSLPSNAQANIRSLGRAFPPPPMCNAPMGRENPAPALYYASFGGLVNAVQYILSQGADVNAQGGKYATALQAASFRGHEKAAKLLLKAGADVNAHGGEYVTALYAASDSGHEKIVELLLKAGANANAHGEKDGTALYAASDSGHEKIVELLLKSGADVNTQGGRYDTAPSYAASLRGHERVVELLLKAGADVNEQGRRHDSALFVASSEGHEKIVELLLKADTNANAQGGGYDTAIYAASVNGHERIVELLLKVNTGVNAQGGKYGAELSIASLKGHEKMVKLLLEAGADVNAQGGDYRSTALHSASSGGHEKVVKLLLEEGADVNAQDENNYGTALQVASLGGREKVVELLLKAGADVNAVGGCYGTALQAASFGGYGDVIKLLLKAGANANVYGGQYGTALHAASFGHEGIAEPTLNAYSFVQIGSYGHSSREKIVELLLNAGANVNAQGGNYGTALQIASLRGREKVVELLLEAGADANLFGGRYGTALQAASIKGYGGVVKLLLKAGADANAAGGEYVTALHAASFKGHEEVVELLLKQGTDVIARVGSCSHGRREKVVEPPLNAGADANAQGGSDDTASPYAALLRSHERIVELLLKAGADANAQGVHSVVGCTELQAASLRGDKKVIELLLMRDSDTDSL